MTRALGSYTALDAHALYKHKSAAGAFYRTVLRAEVRARLPWVRWREVRRGLFEIDGVPEAVLRHFSQRRAEIEQRAMELVAAGAERSRELMQAVALATRRAKDYGVAGATWREQARARAAEHGFGTFELDALERRGPTRCNDLEFGAVLSRLSGPEGLTATHNTFERRHALAELAGAFAQGATPAQLERATSRYLDHATVRVAGRSIG